MDDIKGLFLSRTVWSNIVAAFCLVMSATGHKADIDQAATADTITTLMRHFWEIAGLLSTVASTYFRATATSRISGVK